MRIAFLVSRAGLYARPVHQAVRHGTCDVTRGLQVVNLAVQLVNGIIQQIGRTLSFFGSHRGKMLARGFRGRLVVCSSMHRGKRARPQNASEGWRPTVSLDVEIMRHCPIIRNAPRSA